jgi:hypothetical protein
MRLLVALALVSWTAGAAWAQQAISARAGLIHYIQGDVRVEGELLKPATVEFSHLERGELLSTDRGRAEILLNPGTFLRLGENSSVRLLSTDLTDTRVELLSGLALIEVEDLRKDNALLVETMGTGFEIRKRGLYHVSVEDGALRVYDGEARLAGTDGDELKVKKGRLVALDGEVDEAEKFDRDETDALYRWSARRARYIAASNASAIRAAGRNGGYGWTFNPLYGMYSFIPSSGYFYSPFGITIYQPRVFIGGPSFGGGGFSGVSGRSSSAASAGSVVRSAPAAAPVSTSGGRQR